LNKKLKKGYLLALSSAMVFSNFSYSGSKVVANEKANEQEVIQNNNDLEKLPPAEISSEETIVREGNKPGLYSLTAYDDAIQMRKSNDQWVNVDTNIRETKDGKYSPESSELKVEFDSKIDSKAPLMVVGEENDKVSIVFKGINTKNEFRPIFNAEAVVKENKITHEDIFNGVDLRHVTLNNEVKEDIILHKPNPEIKSFVYDINTKLTAELNEDGFVTFKKKDNTVAYTMPIPMMSDSKIDEKSGVASESYDISYDLKKTESGYQLILEPSTTWLNNDDRVYPIYIDPTLVKEASLDTFVSSAYPSTPFNKYWSSALSEYVLRVGKYDASTGTNYSFVKMPSLSDLKGATISNASFKTFAKWSYYADTKTGIWIDKVNSNWSESSLDWDARPSSTNISSTTVSRNQWATFNITSAIKSIADGSRTDYGFKLHANGNGQSYWKQLTASENSKNKTSVNVTYSYPKMGALKTSVYPSGVGATTGYINISWPAAKYASNYRLQLYNGKGWRTIYNGKELSYSTKDKKIWPKESQYTNRDSLTGGIAFREGDGMELPMDPSTMYSISSGIKSTSKAYQFRVVADYPLGSGAASSVSKPVLDGIIPESPSAPIVDEVSLNKFDGTGDFDISWDEVEGATSYDLQLFNGNNYERFSVGNSTSWSTKGKKIFPLPYQVDEINSGQDSIFKLKGDGTDFVADPRYFYSKSGTKYANVKNYYVKVIAKSSKGESLPSAFTRVYIPSATPDVSYKGVLTSPDNGYIHAEWKKEEDVDGYVVSMFNGKEKQVIEKLDKNATSWSTKDKNLWPKDDQGYKLRTDSSGRELLSDPNITYKKIDKENEDSSYHIDIEGFRHEDTTKDIYDLNRYHGRSGINKESDIQISSVITPAIQKIDGVNNEYPAMNAPIIKPFANEDKNETGYFNMDWQPVEGASAYKVYIFNGHSYDSWTVSSDETSWTSSEENIYPSDSQLDLGNYSFIKNNSGGPLMRSPEKMYNTAYEKNKTSNDYTNVNDYFVRIAAILPEGETPASEATSFVIPEPNPVIDIEELTNPDQTRQVKLSWNLKDDETVNLYVYNGLSYKKYDLGSSTSWDSNKAKIWPTASAGELSEQGKGTILPLNPQQFFKNNNPEFVIDEEENGEYSFKVEVVKSDGSSKITEITTSYKPINKSNTSSMFDNMSLEEVKLAIEEKMNQLITDENSVSATARTSLASNSNTQSLEDKVLELRKELEKYFNSNSFNVDGVSSDEINNFTDTVDELDQYLPEEAADDESIPDENDGGVSAQGTNKTWRYGDILYYPMGADLHKKLKSGKYQKTGDSAFGHTAVLSMKRGYVIEATPYKKKAEVFHQEYNKIWSTTDGVIQYKVTSWLGKNKSKSQRKKAVEFGMKQIGEPYALRTFVQTSDHWYCSKLTYRQWKSAGVDLKSVTDFYIPTGADKSFITPIEISIDANTRKVRGWSKGQNISIGV